MSFEQQMQSGLFTSNAEKTFIDKLLGRKDVEAIREIIRKPRLNREDLLDLLYMLSSVESKLLNYGPWDRYIILKYFVWIREFVALSEHLFDYKDRIEAKELTGQATLSPRTKQLFDNNIRLMEHNVKFLVDLYFNIGRTTLSLGATGFLEPLKNKYEVNYPQQQALATSTPTEKGIIKT